MSLTFFFIVFVIGGIILGSAFSLLESWFDAMSESPGWTMYFTVMILAFLFGNIWLGVIMIIAGIACLVYDAAKTTSKEDI